MEMGTSPAQVPLKMAAGFHTGCTLDTKANFVNFTWYDELMIAGSMSVGQILPKFQNFTCTPVDHI